MTARDSIHSRLHSGPRLGDESGLTLIELLIALMLSLIVLGIVGGLFVVTSRSEGVVTTRTQATSAGQTIVQSVQRGINNASEFTVLSPGVDKLVIARTAGIASTLSWVCRAWYYSATGDGSIRMTTTNDGTKITVPTASELQTWTLLADGVTSTSGTQVFSLSGSRQLDINLSVAVTGGAPVVMTTTTLMKTGVTEANSCY
jgi:type II secretory pathway pseudopilin PulG